MIDIVSAAVWMKFIIYHNILWIMYIQYAAKISPQSARHVHHIILYLCEGMNFTGHPAVGVSEECDGIAEELEPCKSSTIIAGWAVGGNVRDQLCIRSYRLAIQTITVE